LYYRILHTQSNAELQSKRKLIVDFHHKYKIHTFCLISYERAGS